MTEQILTADVNMILDATKIKFNLDCMILNATKIKFDGNDQEWQEALCFDLDGTLLWVPAANLEIIFFDERYVDAHRAFIEKLANPVRFMNNEIVKTMKLPKEFMLQVAMSKLAGE